MILVRDLVLTSLRHNILFRAYHVPVLKIPGQTKFLVYRLYRFQESFPRCRPRANSCAQDPSPAEVVDTLKELLHSLLLEQSRKQYSRAWVVFTEFYTRYQSANLHLPVSTACIALFISFLCARGLAPATINSCLSAIAYVHKIKGLYDPTKAFLVEKLLVALGRCGQADVRMPILRPLLYALVRPLQHTSPSAYRRSLFGAMFITAFYGFFRIGELSCKSKSKLTPLCNLIKCPF